MEEEKTKPILKETEFKIYYASYSQNIPTELLSFIDSKTPPNHALLQDNLEIIENPESLEISLNINPNPEEKCLDILCKIFEIDLVDFQNFLAINEKEPNSINSLKEKQSSKEFKLIFSSKEKSNNILLFPVGDYNNFPLLSIRHLESKKASNIFDGKQEKDSTIFFNEFSKYFKDVLDQGALQHYLRTILFETQNKEKAHQIIENILKENYPNVEKVENKESKLLFSLKTKEFYGAKMLELPKFNREKGNFEAEEKLKLVL